MGQQYHRTTEYKDLSNYAYHSSSYDVVAFGSRLVFQSHGYGSWVIAQFRDVALRGTLDLGGSGVSVVQSHVVASQGRLK